MTNLPAPPTPPVVHLPVIAGPPSDSREELDVRQIAGMLRRNIWLICAGIVAGIGLGIYATSRTTPVYEASVTVRIEEKTPNLPGFFRVTSAGSDLSTEAEVLRSRTLAEATVKELGLQVRVVEPKGAVRDDLLRVIRVDSLVRGAVYRLRADGEGRWQVTRGNSDTVVARVAVNELLLLPGAALRLDSAAARHADLTITISSAVTAAKVLLGTIRVSQPGRDVKILRLQYEDTDREMVWRVPNAMVKRFIARRSGDQKEEARSTVEFLRRQLDTLAGQLLVSENALRAYRERHLVVSPQAEASSQVSRLIAMEAERGTLEGEQAALAKLLEDVDQQAARKGAGDPSPYRSLLAFPTLLRSQAAADLLNTLSGVEQERTTLLARRTPEDPDVIALNDRVSELEGQLRSVVVAYLQGLQNQMATIDAGLNRFGAKLGRLPEREIEVARLERQPKVLGEIYTLLQTRLKEAEIAEAAQDPSVRLVDPATRPVYPVRPRRMLNLMAGVLGGLLVGLALTVARELRDRAVRTRADVRVATGLPVLGLIPRIPLRGRRFALIAETRGTHRATPPPPRPEPPPVTAAGTRPRYTFLGTAESEVPPAELPPTPTASPASTKILRMAVSELGLPMAEAYGILETNIAFARTDTEVKVVVLTSALPRDGKTTTAVNLALTLARRGLTVLLIDADLRRGLVHTAFEARRDPGLSDVLRAAVSLEQARGMVEIEGRVLHYLTAGSHDPSPTGCIHSGAMRELLDRLRAEYDLVIIDSPPANIVTDAALLAAMADGVIMVARAGFTEGGALSVAMDQLRHVRAPVIGVILNDIDFKRDAAYDGAYRYYNYTQYMSRAGT